MKNRHRTAPGRPRHEAALRRHARDAVRLAGLLALILATHARPATAAPIVAYYVTINTPNPTANQVANTETVITGAGATPFQINAANIATFSLAGVSMIYSGAYDSPFIVQRAADVEAWVRSGGVILIDDAVNVAQYNFTGTARYPTNTGSTDLRNIDFVPPVDTRISNGPAGVLTNTSLDNGSLSFHFTIAPASLPPGARALMQAGTDTTRVVAFSYPLDDGFVYHSSIPMAYYLDNLGSPPFSTTAKTIYLPNLLAYGLAYVPEPATALLLTLALAVAHPRRHGR